jgi:hypothetical protein
MNVENRSQALDNMSDNVDRRSATVLARWQLHAATRLPTAEELSGR